MEGQCWFQSHGDSNTWHCIAFDGRPLRMNVLPMYSETLAIPMDKDMGRWRMAVGIPRNSLWMAVLKRLRPTFDCVLIESAWINE